MNINQPCWGRGLLFLFSIVLFSQCDKEEPSTEASIETSMELFSNTAMQGKLTIEGATVQALQVDMVAKRTDGNQLTFSQSNSSDDKTINLVGGSSPFRLPAQQGKYDPIQVSLTFQADPYELVVTPGSNENPPSVDFGSFLQNAKPSMMFNGTFNNRGQSTTVYVALNIPDRLRIDATQLGSTLVALGRENRARFVIDPSYLLQGITIQTLESADSFDYNGEKIILIHERFNVDIYEDIFDRLLDSSAIRVDIIEIGKKG